MNDQMESDKRYRVDHPLFESTYFRNGELCPGSLGHIARANGTPTVMQGRLFFRGQAGLPKAWSGEIQVSGLKLIFPNGEEAEIYLSGAERPSTKAQREEKLHNVMQNFSAEIDVVVSKVMTKLGQSRAPDASEDLSRLLTDLSGTNGHAQVRLNGYLRGLQAASILNRTDTLELVEDFKRISEWGDVVQAYRNSQR